MPLDATVGGANANSYNTRAEFTAWLGERVGVPGTFAPTDPQKDNALMLATRWLDTLCWLGGPATTVQALKFPRVGLLDRNGNEVASNIIPSDLKYTTHELAYQMLVADRITENQVAVRGITSIKAGPVSLSFKDELTTFNVIPDVVKMLLPQDWLCPESRVVVPADNEPVMEVL